MPTSSGMSGGLRSNDVADGTLVEGNSVLKLAMNTKILIRVVSSAAAPTNWLARC